uniref:Transcription and mRNA export factor ENY2 n=1 Tax=Parastrongyloides trichosuri TaxID=131310 RepID=A0A0N4Z463_PARTI
MAQPNFKTQEQMKNEYLNSGEAEKITQELKQRLEASGYNEKIREICKEYIQKKGINNVSLTELFEDIGKDRRLSIDQDIKNELTRKIREFVENNITQPF